MGYNFRFRESVRWFLEEYSDYEAPSFEVAYNRNNIFNAYLRIMYEHTDSHTEIEIPTAYVRKIKDIFYNNGHTPKVILIPIFTTGEDDYKTTFDSALRSIGLCNCRRIRVKDHIYYAGRGMILDKDFNLLLLTTRSYKFEWSREEGGYMWNYLKNVVRISPDVFEHNNRTLERGIINRFMPYMSASIAGFNSSACRVIIDNLDHMIARPVRPKFNDLDDLHHAVQSNIDEIVGQIYDD